MPRAQSVSDARTNGAKKAEALNRRTLLAAMRAFRRGDFQVRLPDEFDGVDGQICQAFNDVVFIAASLSDEAAALRQSVGLEGRTRRRIRTQGTRGGWAVYTRSINELLDDLTSHSEEVANV